MDSTWSLLKNLKWTENLKTEGMGSPAMPRTILTIQARQGGAT